MEKALHSVISAISGHGATEAPEWLHLLPAGSFTGADGRGPFQAANLPELVSAFDKAGRKIPVDENHSIDLKGSKGEPSPARGWITSLQARDNGLWGKVEWTAEGKALVEGKAYGFLSPALMHLLPKPHRIVSIESVSLVNDPNIRTLKSLHSKEDQPMLEELRKAFGLPETADEAAILAAVAKANNASTANAALMARVAEVAGVAVTADGDALVTALQAKTTPASGAASGIEAENASLRDQVKSLNSQVQTLVTTGAHEKAVATVDAAIAAGKIVPALRDHMISRHSKNPAEVEAEIKVMPSINAGGLGGRQPPPVTEIVTDEELKIASMMSVDPAAYKEQHKALFGKGQ